MATSLPTVDLTQAREFAAHVRIAIALVGGLILIFDPASVTHPIPAGIGLGIIGLTGVLESVVRHQRWLAFEESFSCLAAVLIVAWSGGEVTAITLLWLVAAATGVLARGGRVGGIGRALVVGALIAPIVMDGVNGERIGLLVGSILMLLAAGRISRETADLLVAARFTADHDDITGVLSRTAFRERVDELAKLTGPDRLAALIVVDIDDFSAVNKRHGNAVGDEILNSVGLALGTCLRRQDALGRVGGDEFGIFAFSDQPGTIAQRLVDTVGGATDLVSLRARAGYALCPFDGETAESLLTGADVALRVSKRSSNVDVTPYQGAQISSSPSGAKAALERLCSGEGVAMAVQPIVDVDSCRPHAYEALARFTSDGNEGPLQWFALAEEFGMRGDLELACLREALSLLPDVPNGARLSVNLSAPLLADERAAELFAGCDDISRLIVEVTEEVLVRKGGEVDLATDVLRERGVEFAVDDIGAGYAGLGQLAALRPSYLKLDRALVAGIDEDPAMESLVRLLATYGRSNDGLVVAEGVETEGEMAAIRDAGVPLVQGYLLARPGPPWPEISASAGIAALA